MDVPARSAQAQDWDPFEPDALRDPPATHAAMRARCPVAFSNHADGSWALFKYDDILAAARDPQRFSNALVSSSPVHRQIPLQSDPPEHTAYRRFLLTYFAPPRIHALDPVARRIATALLDALLERGGGDFIPIVAYPMPARTLCAFLNQPDDDWLEIKRIADEVFQTDSRFAGSGDNKAALESLYRYARSIVQARKVAPLDPRVDMATGLLEFEIDGRRLDDETVVGILRLMLTAGHNSTTSALGILALYLASHQDVQDLLRAEPQRLPNAVEEILRWESPVQLLPRVLTQDVEIRGRRLRAGDQVALMWMSGNRDEEAFDQADQCIIDRDTRRNLVFGSGIHKCIGASLARLELRVVFEELLRRTQRFVVDGQVARSHWPRYGVTRLPLRFTD